MKEYEYIKLVGFTPTGHRRGTYTITFDPHDPKDVVHAMERLVMTSGDELKLITVNTRDYMRQQWTDDVIAGKTELSLFEYMESLK